MSKILHRAASCKRQGAARMKFRATAVPPDAVLRGRMWNPIAVQTALDAAAWPAIPMFACKQAYSDPQSPRPAHCLYLQNASTLQFLECTYSRIPSSHLNRLGLLRGRLSRVPAEYPPTCPRIGFCTAWDVANARSGDRAAPRDPVEANSGRDRRRTTNRSSGSTPDDTWHGYARSRRRHQARERRRNRQKWN